VCNGNPPKISSSEWRISSVSGEHKDGKTTKDVTILDVKNSMNVEYLPNQLGDFFPSLEIVSITHNNLKFIGRNNFKWMRKLNKLFLRNNQLTEIEENSFDDLINVDRIDMNDNNLKVMPKNLLVHMRKLLFFNADNNNLEFIEPGFFAKNTKLIYINVNGNKLKQLFIECVKRSQLQFVNVKYNDCSTSISK